MFNKQSSRTCNVTGGTFLRHAATRAGLLSIRRSQANTMTEEGRSATGNPSAPRADARLQPPDDTLDGR